VRAVYDGFYLRLAELSEEGNRFFLGAEGIIGSELFIATAAQAGADGQLEEAVLLRASDGRTLARIEGEAAGRLAGHLSHGWRAKALLATTFFRAQDKRGSADIACLCWAPELAPEAEAALATFSKNIAERLTRGDRAGLEPSQEQFIRILQSGGEWFLTPTVKREPLQKGTVVYKSQRSGTERLTGFALKHRVGCNTLASIFWILVILGIIVLVWRLFFS
jgi:hypothetical protein